MSSNLTDAAMALRKYERTVTEMRKLVLEALALLEKNNALRAEGVLRQYANNHFGGFHHGD